LGSDTGGRLKASLKALTKAAGPDNGLVLVGLPKWVGLGGGTTGGEGDLKLTGGEGGAVVDIGSGAFILSADKLSFNGSNSPPGVYESWETSVLEGSSRPY
jgi:hypothetical protein